MSQQSLDLRRSVQVVRRHKILVGVIAIVGLFLGGAYSVLNPPLLTSQALVVIPQNSANISTEVVIVKSEPVLSEAASKLQPPMSLATLEGRVSVKSLTSGVISINAGGSTPAQAESAANAVAGSYISYVGHAQSPGGRISAQVLQPATATSGSGAPKQDILGLLIGLIGGLLAGVILALLVGLRDRRLVERDAIANSLGVPVLAAIQAGRPADAAEWTRLLSDYVPEPVDAWRMRQALQEFGIEGVHQNGPVDGRGFSVTVLSLSSDPGVLALGPQLAVFAASLKIPVALVISQQQETRATAALRTACAAPPGAASHSEYLRIFTADDGRAIAPQGARLTVVVQVADWKSSPKLPETQPTTVTVLGVTAGAATADQLARLATAAASQGRDIVGFFVANPDPADQTSGRFPRPGAGLAGRMRRLTAEPEAEPRPAAAPAAGGHGNNTSIGGPIGWSKPSESRR